MAKAPKTATTDGYQLSLKVSPKGGVQLNGLRRFPVTLYADEWDAVLSRADAIRKFIETNRKKLKAKGDNDDAGGGGVSI